MMFQYLHTENADDDVSDDDVTYDGSMFTY